MNELAVVQSRQLSAADMRLHVNLIQGVMQAVMKENVHFGIIPGTPKRTLYKPGAEVLCVTFRIAPSYQIEDLSTDDCIRYRVRSVATHQTTGSVLGEGMGEASSNEEKYKWRKAVSRAEFEATPENRRRIKYGYNRAERREYEVQQVRAESADVANTILKMACKRAQVAMTLNVTAASDIFAQDIEDLPEHLRHDEDERNGAPEQQKEEKHPKSKSQAKKEEAGEKPEQKQPTTEEGGEPITTGQMKILRIKMDSGALDDADFAAKFGCKPAELPRSKINDALAWCSDPTK